MYNTVPQLDGEYIDSFLAGCLTLDYNPEHVKVAEIPLTYEPSLKIPGVPQVRSVISTDIHITIFTSIGLFNYRTSS